MYRSVLHFCRKANTHAKYATPLLAAITEVVLTMDPSYEALSDALQRIIPMVIVVNAMNVTFITLS